MTVRALSRGPEWWFRVLGPLELSSVPDPRSPCVISPRVMSIAERRMAVATPVAALRRGAGVGGCHRPNESVRMVKFATLTAIQAAETNGKPSIAAQIPASRVHAAAIGFTSARHHGGSDRDTPKTGSSKGQRDTARDPWLGIPAHCE
jgi:hypothetical protein